MKKLIISLVFITNIAIAQVGIGTNEPLSTLDIRAKNHNGVATASDGLIVPRVSVLGVNGIEPGQMLYLTQDDTVNNHEKGFYFWSGEAWGSIAPEIASPNDNLIGDQTKDGWVDSPSTGSIILGTKSNGAARASNNDLIIKDNGNIGIGTASPAQKLHINGNVRIENKIMSGASNSVNFASASGSEFMWLKTNGSLALGSPTIDEGVKMQVHGGYFKVKGGFQPRMIIDGESYSDKGVVIQSNGQEKWKMSSAFNDSQLQFRYNGSSQIMTLRSSGNIGVGISSPTEKFHVMNGRITASNSSSTYGNKMQMYVKHGDNKGVINYGGTNDSNDKLEFSIEEDPKLLITGDNKMGIGTSNPEASFHLLDRNQVAENYSIFENSYPIQNASMGIKLKTNNGTRAEIVGGQYDSSAAGTFSINTYDMSGISQERLKVDHAGNIGIGTEAPKAKLDVDGEIKIADSGSTCSSTNEGSMKYNSNTKKFQGCDGTTWVNLN